MHRFCTLFTLVIYLFSFICPISSFLYGNELSNNPSELVQEELFPNGHRVVTIYDEQTRPICIEISEMIKIRYEYNKEFLSKIHRLDSNDTILYSHTYLPNGKELLIGELGVLEYVLNESRYICLTPYSLEICEFDGNKNIIEHRLNNETFHYDYDQQNRLLSKNNLFQDKITQIDDADCLYDLEGNLIHKEEHEYVYDKNNRLVQVITEDKIVSLSYDEKNRRISKQVETAEECYEYTYLYSNEIPIAIFKNSILEQLNIPGKRQSTGFTKSIAIETPSAVYAPIYDIQCNLSKLINIETQKIITFDIDPYGTNLSKQSLITPFLFATKEYDSEINLVYFDYRYYNPSMQRWLTKDPLLQKENHLYTYCFHNPLRYLDPDGRFVFVFAIPLGIEITGAILGKALLYGCMTAGAAWAGAKGVEKGNEALQERNRKKRIEEIQRQEIQNQQGYKSPQENPEKKTPGNMQKQVERGQAPKSIKRVDYADEIHNIDHIHFKDGRILNSDGTWRNPGCQLTNQEKLWIQKNGWRTVD